MTKNIMPVLTPDFYSDFHCAAAGCRNNCCVHPWSIYINKKNYKQVRALKEPKWLSENLSDYIKRNPHSTSDSDYALAVYNQRGCAFQTEEGLCRLQMEAGAQYLSVTCQVYPRQDGYLVTPGALQAQKERSLTVSCEEVVRMLFHKPQPIQFVTSQEEYNPANFNSEVRHASNFIFDKGERPMLAHYSLIRAISIALLQNRDYSIEQRMLLLILYLDKLAQAERDGTESGVPAMTDTFVAAVEARLYDGVLASDSGAVTTAYLSNLVSVLAFAGHAEARVSTIQQSDANIAALGYPERSASYRAFIADKEYFVEHLLVMEFFGKMLPFKTTRSIDDCAQYMVSIFTSFRFMLGAYLGQRHDLPETEFIDFTAFFGKSVLHSPSSFDRNINLLKENGMNTLPYLMSIILG